MFTQGGEIKPCNTVPYGTGQKENSLHPPHLCTCQSIVDDLVAFVMTWDYPVHAGVHGNARADGLTSKAPSIGTLKMGRMQMLLAARGRMKISELGTKATTRSRLF